MRHKGPSGYLRRGTSWKNRQKEDPAHSALLLGNTVGKAASRPVFEVWDNHGLPDCDRAA